MQRSNSGVMQTIIDDMSDELTIQEIEDFLFVVTKCTTYTKDVLYQWSPSKIREFVLSHQQQLQVHIQAQEEQYYKQLRDMMIR